MPRDVACAQFMNYTARERRRGRSERVWNWPRRMSRYCRLVDSPNLRERNRGRRPLSIKCFEPEADASPKALDFDLSIDRWESIKPSKGRLQQRCGADNILALQMMKRRGYLNQPLEECLFRLVRLQPNRFPMLVSVEELLAAIAAQSFSEGAGCPVKGHGVVIIVQRLHYVIGGLARLSVHSNR